MKKFLFVALLLAALFTVAACKPAPTEETPVETPVETPTPTPTPDPSTPDAVLANGVYNFKFADADLRHYLFAMAEKYLLNTMHAGVPVFANAGFSMFSNRMQLAVEQSLPVMGFGVAYSTMAFDDRGVLMDDGNFGQAGKYTLRTSIAQNPSTFNQWIYTDATSSDMITLFLDSLYAFRFNDDKTGYQVVPSMASADPVPVNSETLSSGKVVSKTWRIPLRTDLRFTYHADTNTSAFPANHEKINAHTFVDTYKYALDEGWFRAISGGGHFFAPTSNVVNAKAYRDFVSGASTVETAWAQVGIKATDDNTIEFTFVDDMSEWNIKYWLSSFVMTPVNFALLNAVGKTNYGTTPQTTAYTGIYKLDYYEPGKVLRFSRNENFHTQDLVFYTGQQVSVITDAEVRFQEFLSNKLDVVGVPTPRYDSFKNHPGIKRVPGATTFRLMINGFGTKEALQETFPDTDFTPEPILANMAFKRAMFFAIDRQYLAEEVLKTSQTQMFLFTDAYLVEAESGIAFRNTPFADLVGEGLSPDTNGFNFDAARALYLQALDELIAAGTYAAGTTANPTIIEISLYIFAGSTAQELFGQYIKSAFEAAFNDTVRNIRVQINYETRPFPGIYFDYMMTGNFDLAIGGISGSTLDAAGFLEVFNSDNRGGFTLNWGIDTNVPEIEVTYTNFDGVLVTEIWSFDALQMALNGPVTVVDGKEVREE
jgi:ABC-type oligopeptide transport system substrate-binding subunit